MADLAHARLAPERDGLVRRAHDLVVWWEGEEAHALGARVGRVVRLSEPLLALLLREASRPRTVDDLASAAHAPRALVRRLADAGLLEPADAPPLSTPWPALELAAQRRTGMPPPADVDLHAAPPPVMAKPTGRRVDVSSPVRSSRHIAFGDVLRSRRSIRRFHDRPVTLTELAEFLTEAAGLQALDRETASSRRAYPSGGARHSLELFVLSLRITDLEQGCWWFDPSGELVVVDTHASFRKDLATLLAQDAAAPAGIVLITSRFERSLYKYGALGLSLIYKDTGCLLQTLYLQATATALAGYAIGGGPEAAIATGLGLDPLQQSYVGAFVFGAAPTPGDG